MNEQIIKVYVKVDSSKCITAIGSSIFLTDLVDWIEIDEGTGDKYAHAQGSYFDKPLVDENGCYNYKLIDGHPVERTEDEKQVDTVYIEQVKVAKLAEISAACQSAIYAGVDVPNGKVTEHFSLTMADQTNLSALAEAVAQGATAVPYHADGQLCRQFTAEEIKGVYAAAKAYIMKQVTLCNHLNVWIRRCTTAAEVTAITYSSALPDDLQANYNAIMGVTE